MISYFPGTYHFGHRWVCVCPWVQWQCAPQVYQGHGRTHQRDATLSHKREPSSKSLSITHSSVSRTYIANGLGHNAGVVRNSRNIFEGFHHFLTNPNLRKWSLAITNYMSSSWRRIFLATLSPNRTWIGTFSWANNISQVWQFLLSRCILGASTYLKFQFFQTHDILMPLHEAHSKFVPNKYIQYTLMAWS